MGHRKAFGGVKVALTEEVLARTHQQWFCVNSAFVRLKALRLLFMCFIGASGKELTCNAGDVRDVGSVPGLGKSLGGVYGNSLRYSCLENLVDRGAWWAAIYGVAQSHGWKDRLFLVTLLGNVPISSSAVDD